jgi:hypothetical protein
MILIPITENMPPTIEQNWLSNLAEKFEINWVKKISGVMKYIRILEVGILDDFFDLVELHTKKDLLWDEDLAKVTDTTSGQVQQFMEHLIRARAMLQQLSTSLVKYQVHAV